MPLAIEIRILQQQQIVDEVYNGILDEANNQPQPKVFINAVASLLLTMVGNIFSGDEVFRGTRLPKVRRPSPAEQHVLSIITFLDEFPRTDSETRLVYWCLLEKLLAETYGTFRRQWMQDFLQRPQKTLGVDSVSAEVRAPHDLVA